VSVVSLVSIVTAAFFLLSIFNFLSVSILLSLSIRSNTADLLLSISFGNATSAALSTVDLLI